MRDMHTPGPWGWDDSIGGWSNLRSMADGSEVIRVDSGRPDNAADARLIAAAPELLALVEEAWNGGFEDMWYVRAGDVIAKARGESESAPNPEAEGASR